MFTTNEFLNTATDSANHCKKSNIMETIGERIEEGYAPFIRAMNDDRYAHRWSTDTCTWLKKHKVLDRIVHKRQDFIRDLIELEVDLEEHIVMCQADDSTTRVEANKDILTFINDRIEEHMEVQVLEDKHNKLRDTFWFIKWFKWMRNRWVNAYVISLEDKVETLTKLAEQDLEDTARAVKHLATTQSNHKKRTLEQSEIIEDLNKKIKRDDVITLAALTGEAVQYEEVESLEYKNNELHRSLLMKEEKLLLIEKTLGSMNTTCSSMASNTVLQEALTLRADYGPKDHSYIKGKLFLTYMSDITDLATDCDFNIWTDRSTTLMANPEDITSLLTQRY